MRAVPGRGDQKLLTVGVVNVTETPQSLVVSPQRARLGQIIKRMATDRNSANTLGQPAQLVVEESTLPEMPAALAPISINISNSRFLAWIECAATAVDRDRPRLLKPDQSRIKL
jgi:hypothetical protein